ncbi:hypothetical protein THER5_1914 [Bifidobacterium thermacidophilum subsp. thermacidophilum]|uniref:Uncharacterized protein n=1 Tax=Bifidobacterium thermacidophilum subsp. thermacidophilum TaxID=79262 RepID=A0A087E2T4_9BIFI|nr:hypothetical protein THER5_1914 [Bifidobacterium thermacidophilum subsp. thermacidophilum]
MEKQQASWSCRARYGVTTTRAQPNPRHDPPGGTSTGTRPTAPKSRSDFRTPRLASGPAIIDRPTAGPNIYCGARYGAPQPSLATAPLGLSQAS